MKTTYKILIPVLGIALIGGGSYFAFHNLTLVAKSSSSQSTQQTATPSNVGLPDSKTLENAIGQFGIVVKTDLISFKTGETYAVVCAVKTTHDDKANTIQYAQIFVLHNIANSGNWQMIWKQQAEEKTELEVVDTFTDISKIMYDNSSLVAVGLQTMRGAKSTTATLHVFQINKSGEIISQKEEVVENVGVSTMDNSLIAKGRFGSYQMSLNQNNVFTNIIKTPLQIVQEMGDNTKLYFTLKDGVIIPESDKKVTVKVGSSVVFVPKDEITAQALKAGNISIYTNGFYKDDHVGPYGTFYLSVPAFNFKEVRTVEFLIVGDINKVPSDTPPPTFYVNVIK